MTEKRFYFSKCCGICDNDKGESDFTNMLHSDEVVDLLNALHEENEQLKNRVKQAIDEINDYTCSIKQLQDKIDVKEALLKQYEEENEQLKKENKELRQYLCWQDMELEEMEDLNE